MSYAAARSQPPRQSAAMSRSPPSHYGADADTIPFRSSARDGHAEASSPAEIDLRQLRHHTKNTLQRIIGLIGESSQLLATPEGQRVARELEHRICLSATISNALFGLTDVPTSMAERLRQLGGALVDLMHGPDQTIRVGVSIRGTCPPHLREAVMRAAHELIGNAIKHGMKDRPSGRIAVRLTTGPGTTILTIVDNGWGFIGQPRDGEGLALARTFAAAHGGVLRLEGTDGMVATLELPHWP